MIRHGSMFSGIEGFGLGFRMAGWPVETVWQAEIDPYCVQLLTRRYPNAVQLGDVSTRAEFPACDVLTAGFPCQPVSQAGKGLAQDDERWLYPFVETAIATAKPDLVILENVRGLRGRGLGLVLASLRDLGYDCQWDLIPAAAVGAPHLRHRFAVVAYPKGRPYGAIFDVTPPVFPWADEEPAKPRLIKSVSNRKQRLSSLGNAVVPQWVAYLALAIERARAAGAAAAPETLFGHTVESYNGTLPYSGLLIDGEVHETATCAPRLDGKRLWPTATASDALGSRRSTARTDEWTSNPGVTLLDKVWDVEGVDPAEVHGQKGATGELLWPTAAASDHKGVSQPGQRRGQLEEAVKEQEGFWPTPGVADASGGRINSPEAREAGVRPSGHRVQTTLADAAAQADENEAGRTLNPAWVEWLMGYPAGWTIIDEAEEAAA